MIGIEKVIWFNKIELKLSGILRVVKKIKKLVLMMMLGEIIKILFNDNKVLWVIGLVILLILSVFSVLMIVVNNDDKSVIKMVLRKMVIKWLFVNKFW